MHGIDGNGGLEVHDVANICKAALQEVIRIAEKEHTWIKYELSLDVPQRMLDRFRGDPQSGMRVECSVESVVVPTNLSNLTAIMGNLDTWASVLSDIAYHKDCPYLSDDLLLLQVISQEMQDINMVTAELCLPMIPFVQRQRFSFLRFCRQLAPDVQAIIDAANKYIEPTVRGCS